MAPHREAVMIGRVLDDGTCKILGSGTVVGPRAVLTARHVLEDEQGNWCAGLFVRLHSQAEPSVAEGPA